MGCHEAISWERIKSVEWFERHSMLSLSAINFISKALDLYKIHKTHSTSFFFILIFFSWETNITNLPLATDIRVNNKASITAQPFIRFDNLNCEVRSKWKWQVRRYVCRPFYSKYNFLCFIAATIKVIHFTHSAHIKAFRIIKSGDRRKVNEINPVFFGSINGTERLTKMRFDNSCEMYSYMPTGAYWNECIYYIALNCKN